MAVDEGDIPLPEDKPQDEEMQMDQSGGGPSGQHGPGRSSMGSSPMTPIYIGLPQKPNKCTFSYRKSYHFYMDATLPSALRDEANKEFIRYYPGSCHDIPWNYLFCYLSPREANFLRTQFTEVRAIQAQCTVSSLGVRLPFETNSSVSVTANANAQYPVCSYGELDKHYYTETLATNIDALRKQMIGDDLYNLAVQDGEQTSFTNLNAQACSRHFKNPLAILYPCPKRKNVENQTEVDALQQHLAEPQIYQFVSMVNGSNYLGPLFHKTYKPKNGLLFSRNTIQTITKPAGKVPSAETIVTMPMRLPVTAYHDIDVLHEDGKKCEFTGMDYIPGWNQPYELTTLENQTTFSLTNPSTPGVQPRFLIGMIPLRNKDKNLLAAQWEFIVDFDLTVACSVGTVGYYGRNETWPEPNYMYPNLQMGTYDDSVVNTEKDIRCILGQRKVKAKEWKKLYPIQNRAVKRDYTPVDPSVEGEKPAAVSKVDYLY